MGKGFPERVKLMIKLAGSQRALARMINVKDPTIIGWLGGAEPFESTLQKISKSTGISMEWLRDGAGDEEEELVKLAVMENSPRIKLKRVRENAGIKIRELSRLTGYEIGVLQAVEDGLARMSESMAEAICRALPGITKEELLDGSDSPIMREENVTYGTFGTKPKIKMAGHKLRYVPLLSWAQAGSLDAGFLDEAYDYSAVISIDINDRNAFGVKIRGNSMEPRIVEGDSVIVCPGWTPKSGDTVICRTVEGDVMCKLFQPKNGGELVILSSYNSAYPPMELKRSEIAWIYPVGQVVQNLRRE